MKIRVIAVISLVLLLAAKAYIDYEKEAPSSSSIMEHQQTFYDGYVKAFGERLSYGNFSSYMKDNKDYVKDHPYCISKLNLAVYESELRLAKKEHEIVTSLKNECETCNWDAMASGIDDMLYEGRKETLDNLYQSYENLYSKG